ncbi:MAG: flippase [Candidatus Woesearchaeota archaeon]|nr:flippase [Candidatus Woesearchaeota archaeon]
MYFKSTVRNSLAVFILGLISGVAGYLFRILLAHNLSVSDYGLFYSMFAFFAFFTVFVDAGLTQSVAKKIVELELKKKYDQIRSLVLASLSFQFIVSVILAIIFLILFPVLSAKVFKTENFTIFLLLVLWFLTLPIDMFFKYLFLGFHYVKMYSSIDPLKTVLTCIFVAIMFSLGIGTTTPFIAYAAINVLILIIFIPVLLRFFPHLLSLNFKLAINLFKPVLIYGWYLAFAGLAWALITYTDTMMISYFRNLTEVGLYQIAMPLANTLLYLIGALNIVSYPLFSKLNAQKESNTIQTGITLLYSYLFVGMIPLALIMFTFPDLVITVLFGAKFVEAATALRILSVGALFFSLASFNAGLLSATGRAKTVARMAAVTAILNVILNALMIPPYGFVGASLASAISFTFFLIASLIVVKKEYEIHMPYLKWIMNFIVGLLTIGVIWWLKGILNLNVWLEVFATLIPAGIFYVALLIIFKVINIKELLAMIKQVIR